MTRVGTSVACGAFFAAAVAIGAGQVRRPAPQLSCALIVDGAESAGPARVSNLKRIALQATLVGPSATTDDLRLGAGSEGEAAPTLEIVAVRRTPANQRLRVQPATIVTGSSVDPDSQRLSVTLEFPIDATTRRRNIEQFLTRIDQAAAADPKLATYRSLLQNRDSAVATFERLYVESVPGDYEVTCRYSSRRPRYWNGSIDSGAPLRLHLTNDGSFFDQPGFR